METNTNSNTLASNPNFTNVFSSSGAAGKVNSSQTESSKLERTTPMLTPAHLQQVEVELVHKADLDTLDGESNNEKAYPKPITSSGEHVKLDIETELIIKPVTLSANMSMNSSDSLSSIHDSSPSDASGECCTVEGKQTEGPRDAKS